MKFDFKNTKKYFLFPVGKSHFDFLADRKIGSVQYFEALRNGQYGYLLENVILIQNRPYCVDCILGRSKESICDLIGTNNLYGLSADKGTAFATLVGDDYLFFKPNDPKVYFYDRDTDETILVAANYNGFTELIKDEES